MGRPKKAEADNRDSDVRIRVSSVEKARIMAAAAKKGLDFSAWARMTLLENAPPVEKTR